MQWENQYIKMSVRPHWTLQFEKFVKINKLTSKFIWIDKEPRQSWRGMNLKTQLLNKFITKCSNKPSRLLRKYKKTTETKKCKCCIYFMTKLTLHHGRARGRSNYRTVMYYRKIWSPVASSEDAGRRMDQGMQVWKGKEMDSLLGCPEGDTAHSPTTNWHQLGETHVRLLI